MELFGTTGQERRRWLDETTGEWVDYFLGPTGLGDRIEGVMSMTPAAGVQESIAGTRTALDDTLSNEDRIDGLLRAGLGIGTTVAPAAAARLMPTVPGASLSDDFARSAAAVEDSFLGYGRDFTGNEFGGIGRADDVTQRGDEVLSLLSEGRGSEVTDEMLDLGDPALNARLNEYLYNNYDLPMDEASRMGRAGDMGFDTDTPLFHGGLTPHQEVRPISDVYDDYSEGVGTYNTDSWHGPGYYTTTSSRDASGNYGSVEGPDIRNKIERRYERIQEMDFDQLADEIRLTLKPEDIAEIDPEAARLLREVNAKPQNSLTTGDVEEWEDYIAGSPILNDLADLTARRQVGETDGLVTPVFGRANNPVRTKNPKSTEFAYQTDMQDPADFLEEAGGDEDLAFDLAMEASFDLEPIGPFGEGVSAVENRLYDVGMDEYAAELGAELRGRAMEDGYLNAADFEHIIRNSSAAADGIDYGVSAGPLINDAYRAMGHDVIDLPTPRTTFSNMPNLEDAAFHRVFTDPTAVRSRFARFDPRLSHLRNLSAGVGGLGMMEYATGTDKEDNNKLRGYLESVGL